MTPVHVCAECGRGDILEWLCEKHEASPKATISVFIVYCFEEYILVSQDGCQPIHFAASNGQVEVVRLLVQKYSADPNMPTAVSI